MGGFFAAREVAQSSNTTAFSNLTSRGPSEQPQVGLDRFKCYTAQEIMGDQPPAVVTLQDQFGAGPVAVGPPQVFCNPVDIVEDGIPMTDPNAHLKCYAITPTQEFVPRDVVVTNQFGTETLRVLSPTLLCLPTQKEQHPPPVGLDHYQCYTVQVLEGSPPPMPLTLLDQFGAELGVQVLDAQLLCTPTDKLEDQYPIFNPVDHLKCYGIASPPFTPRTTYVTNQFGYEVLQVIGPDMLCVPSSKTVLETTPTPTPTNTPTKTPTPTSTPTPGPSWPENPSFSLAMGALTAPPDAILKLNPVVGGPPVVAIWGWALGLGFVGPDDLNSLSYGMEYPNNVTPFLRFSMARDNGGWPDGLQGTHVRMESTCMPWPGQATGDEFDAPMPPPPVGFGNMNTQVLDENGIPDALGCAVPPGYPVGTGAPPGDNLDALEDRPPSFVDDGSGGGVAGDGIPDRPVFFTLAPGSATLWAIGATAADILWSAWGLPPPPMLYAPGPVLGLNMMPPFNDAIDGLMMYDNGDLVFGPGDWAWLSLMPGSPTLGMLGASEGDVLFVDGAIPGVISVEYTADQLGLCDWFTFPLCIVGNLDDVDALKGSIPCKTGGDHDAAIGNGKSIAGDDASVPSGEFPAANDCLDNDDDNDRYRDDLELLLPDSSCPAKTALTSPGGDITYDDDNDGDPAAGSLGGTDPTDDPASWDSDGDSVLDGAECTLGTDPANPASKPTTAQCGGTGDTDGDGLLNAWETCKWSTNPAVQDSDGDTKGDCVEAVDTDGNGIVDYGGDALNSARATLLPAASFGKDGDFDLNGNNVLMGDFGADTLTVARMAFKILVCK